MTLSQADGHVRMHARDAPLSVMLSGQKYRHVDNVDVCDNGALQNFTAVSACQAAMSTRDDFPVGMDKQGHGRAGDDAGLH